MQVLETLESTYWRHLGSYWGPSGHSWTTNRSWTLSIYSQNKGYLK